MSGIDDIVELILKEARKRDKGDLFLSACEVMEAVKGRFDDVIMTFLKDERRKKEHENNN